MKRAVAVGMLTVIVLAGCTTRAQSAHTRVGANDNAVSTADRYAQEAAAIERSATTALSTPTPTYSTIFLTATPGIIPGGANVLPAGEVLRTTTQNSSPAVSRDNPPALEEVTATVQVNPTARLDPAPGAKATAAAVDAWRIAIPVAVEPGDTYRLLKGSFTNGSKSDAGGCPGFC
jgi:hypothetical protein